MILSDKDILAAIESGDIKIDRFDKKLLNPGSYTFTLNNVIFKPRWPEVIDARSPEIEYAQIKMSDSGYELKPGEFVLAQTYEKVSINQSLGCFLDARTTLARIGLNVLQGSTFIEPGQQESHETLEVSNIGQSAIIIYPKMKIVKGVFVRLAQSSAQNYAKVGKYRRQKQAGVVNGDKKRPL